MYSGTHVSSIMQYLAFVKRFKDLARAQMRLHLLTATMV